MFVVDTSGSMYSNKISAVNAALYECVGVIREKIRDGLDINVFYSSFDETMKPISKLDNILDRNLPKFETIEENGFYKLTSFSKLYDGLIAFFEDRNYSLSEVLIVLITDGKAVDSMKYESKLNKIKNIKGFRKAIKIVARVDGGLYSSSQDLFEFVDNNANRICELSGLANEINILISSDCNYNHSDDSFYNTIFK